MSYSPLHEPEDRSGQHRRHRGDDGLVLTRRARSLWTQIDLRALPPPEVWGLDARRQRIAAILCGIVRDVMGWPNGHYLPEDPLKLLLRNPRMDGSIDVFEWEMTFAEIRLRTGCEADASAYPEEATLGNLVDAVLEGAPDFERIVELSRPRRGKQQGEACPFLGVFLDLRERLTLPPFNVPRSQLLPSARVCGLVPGAFLPDLRWFVQGRFGVRLSLSEDDGLGDGLALGLTATIVIVVAMFVFAAVLAFRFELADFSILIVPLGIFVISLFVTGMLAVPRLFVRILNHKKPRIRYRMTFGELVKLILHVTQANERQAV